MRLNYALLATIFGLWVGLSHVAGAVEGVSGKLLRDECSHYTRDRDSDEAIRCLAYIHGFIDGAVATDARVVFNVAEEYEKQSGFNERAMRTRLGTRVDRYGGTSFADFCIPAPVDIDAVVRTVIDHMEAYPGSVEKLAREVVYRALTANYPCEEKGK